MSDPFFAQTLELVTGPSSAYTRPAGIPAGLDLSVGEARFPFPPPVQDVVQDAVTGLDQLWYGDPVGDEGLRTAYAATLPTTADRVLVCAGGKEAAWLAVRHLRHRHRIRRALVPRPGWEPYTLWLTAAGCEVIGYDPAELAAIPASLADLLPAGPAAEATMLVLNYPHNPTGISLAQNGMDQLVAIAGEYGVPLVSDEVYRTFAPGGVSVVHAPGYDPVRHLVVDSTSKWLTTAGLRVGFLTADPDTIRTLTAFRGTYASHTGGLGQRVAAALITSPATTAWLAEVRTSIDTVRAATASALAGHGVEVASHGGLYLWAHRLDPATPSPGAGVPARLSDGAGFGAPGMVRVCTARAGLDPITAAAAVATALKG